MSSDLVRLRPPSITGEYFSSVMQAGHCSHGYDSRTSEPDGATKRDLYEAVEDMAKIDSAGRSHTRNGRTIQAFLKTIEEGWDNTVETVRDRSFRAGIQAAKDAFEKEKKKTPWPLIAGSVAVGGAAGGLL